MKRISRFILVLAVMIGCIYGGCGSCSVASKKDTAVPSGDFVIKVNQDGIVNGLVLASCGMCNFGTKDKTCSLSIQINEKAYNVEAHILMIMVTHMPMMVFVMQ